MAPSTDSTNEKALEAGVENNHLTADLPKDEKKRKSWRKSKAEKTEKADNDSVPDSDTPEVKKEEDVPPASFTSLFRYVFRPLLPFAI